MIEQMGKNFEPEKTQNKEDIEAAREELLKRRDKINEDINAIGRFRPLNGEPNPAVEPLLIELERINKELNELEPLGKRINEEERGD